MTYEARAFAVFHFVNCYEEDGQVVADMCVSTGDLYKKLYLEALTKNEGDIPPSNAIRLESQFLGNVDSASVALFIGSSCP